MAIATGAALLGAAALSAGAGIYGASKSAKAQNKAADKAADMQTAAGDKAAQVALQTATMNNTLARDMYSANAARLDPYATNGLYASNALTDMLLGTSTFNPNVNPYAGTAADPAARPTTPPTTPPATPGTPGTPAPNALVPFSGAAMLGGATLSPRQPNALAAVEPTPQQYAQQAIAAGADPAAVNARLNQMTGG